MRFTILGSENHVVHRGFNQFKTLKSVFLPLHNMISMTTTQVYTDTATTRMIKKNKPQYNVVKSYGKISHYHFTVLATLYSNRASFKK